MMACRFLGAIDTGAEHNMISRFLKNNRSLSKTKSPRSKKVDLSYGSLEPRQMLAVTVTYNPVNSLLIITGTGAADEVYVNDLNNGIIEVDVVGQAKYPFDQGLIEEIDFEGGNGDDIIVNNTDVPMTAYGFAGDDYMVGGTGADFLHGGPGADTIIGGDGGDDLNGHVGDDIIDGGKGADFIQGGWGNDIIDAGEGNDIIGADWGDDIVYAGPGNDNIQGFSGDDQLHGGTGVDLIYGQYGADLLYGDEGNDRLRGGPGPDTMWGGADDDFLSGEQDNDIHYGEAGNDYLIGFTGDDYLDGGPGDDNLQGQQDNDELRGGDGNDILRGHGGDDLAYGGAGDDYSRLDAGNDTFYGGAGNDLVFGGAGNDQLYGEDGLDDVRGEAGDDTLRGGLGADIVNGGAGNDSLFGGLDADDSITGGTGFDRFLVRSSDTITDQSSVEDAALVFEDVSSTWVDGEVENFDIAFAKLASTPAGIRMLRDSVDAGDLTFYKYDDLGGNAGINSFSYSWYDEWINGGWVRTYTFSREIRIVDWDETNAFQNDQFQDVLIHEIGHNWDSDLQLTQASSNLANVWQGYLDISGWTDTDPGSSNYTASSDGQWWYLNTATFFQDYGKTNPAEDMGTTWERYFSGDVTSDSQLLAKLAVLDQLFQEFAP